MSRLRVALGFRWMVAVVGLGLLPACGGDGQAGPGPAQKDTSGAVTELRSDAARVVPETGEATRAGTSEQAFGLDLLQVLEAHDNLAFSPHSMSTAFAMLTDAAGGTTLDEIADTFHFGTTDEAFHRSGDAIELALAARNREPIAEDDRSVDAQILSESNDIYIRDDAPPADSFLQTLARYYGAGVFHADFGHAPEAARQAINDKVSTDTHALIPELIPPDVITRDTVTVLTNALYFKAPWASRFAAPTPGAFTRLDGSSANVDMLKGIGTWRYYAGKGFVSVAVPYYGDDIEMMLLVPDAGAYDTVRAGLSDDVLGSVVAERTPTLVDVTLPKFSVKSVVPATKALQTLGMTTPFDADAADFPKLVTPLYDQVYISEVLHQATVAIDEKGTEASAATAIVVAGTTSVQPDPPVPLVINVDRPFLFVIRDNPTGATLFVGQVVAP